MTSIFISDIKPHLFFRYLVQQEKAVLTKHDIDAFLAQALSSHLTTDHNVQNLANIKLNAIDARWVCF